MNAPFFTPQIPGRFQNDVYSTDANYTTTYVYGQDGQRSNKYTKNSETLYFNKMWTHRTDSALKVYGGQTAKNIYLGETRIVTKLNAGSNPTVQEESDKQYFYHSDHLGSASLISDCDGNEYQRIEYTPYGEIWVEKTENNGLAYLPYKFTGKEMDEETGLYYYGARYLDPKYSRWISTDPALGEYIPKAPINDDAKRYNQNLPGMGGIFNHTNADLYHYAGNNPVRYIDPDGNELKDYTRKFTHYVCDKTGLTEKSQKGEWPTEKQGFAWDPTTQVYHTTIDCWQGSSFDGWLGYNRLYDGAFDIGTYMDCRRFPFTTDDGTEYILWAWKGDYLNLGAGCEMGIYRKGLEAGLYVETSKKSFSISASHYIVDTGLAMNTTVTLRRDGRLIGSFAGLHWWPNVFVPREQDAKPNELKVSFSWDFTGHEDLFNALKRTYGGKYNGWTFIGNTATFDF